MACDSWTDSYSAESARRIQKHKLLPIRDVYSTWRALSSSASSPPNRIAIIGGGISGLSAAYFLQKALPQSTITLYEGSERTGGWVSSKTVTSNTGDLVFEEGPRSLRPAGLPGLNLLDLVRQLGIDDKMILVPKTAPSAKNRFIYYAGQVHKLPSSFLGFLRFALRNPILKGSLWSILCEPFRRRPAGLTDETIGSFISRRFSPIMAQNMLSAVVHGIYSGSIDQLSIRSTFRALWEYETKAGSVIAGLLRGVETMSKADLVLQSALKSENAVMLAKMKDISVYSFHGGLSALTNALTMHLSKCPNITLDHHSCESIVKNENGTVLLTSGDSRARTYDRVVSSVRAKDISLILQHHKLPELDEVVYSTVMVINFFYKDPDILPITGFGYLIPKSVPLEENPDRALGIVFDTSSVPGQDSAEGTKVTCIMGGHFWQGRTTFPDAEAGYEATRRVMALHLGITAVPERWQAKLQRDCIPQYTVGHIDRMARLHDRLQTEWPQLGLVGSSYGGVSVNDCVLNARRLAMNMAGRGTATGLEEFARLN